MARRVKTDPTENGYQHREHKAKGTRREFHRRKRAAKIMRAEHQAEGRKKSRKFKANNF